jgi:NAD(P)-dependent dehydrogenase (short-subunit alcohol dehydrogenase family)
MSLDGRRILVTGGSQGIGREVARAAATAGASVVVAARGEATVDEAIAELPGDGHLGVPLDVAIPSAWESAINDIGRPLHGVVAAAGILGPIGPPGSYLPEEFLHTLQVNVYGTYLAVHFCLPALRACGHGAVVTFSGGGGTSPLPRFDAYAASKAGVVRLTENLAHGLAGDGITVNAIAPGFVATRMQDAVLAAGPERAGPEYHAEAERKVAEGGVSPRAAADLAVFLLSDEARGFSGKLISAEWDDWRDPELRARLVADPDLAVLRRIDGVIFDRKPAVP